MATYLLVGWMRKRITDPVLDSSISFLTPFAAYVVAEAGHGSGILAVVVAGLLLGHRAPVLQTASSRIAERLNWSTISFVLENTVFLLIGLQASRVIRAVAGSDVTVARTALVCAVVLFAVVALRMVWVLPAQLLVRRSDRGTDRESSWQDAVIMGWAGMRGVVTLAAAFAIPRDFPERDILVLVALVVTGGTLFIHGLSLSWLARWLNLPAPDAREDALARASLFQSASAAGLRAMQSHDSEDDAYGTLDVLRERVEQRDFAAWERLGSSAPESETPSEAYARLRLEMLQAERAKVLQVRSEGRVPHDVVEDVLSSLDVEESMLGIRQSRRERLKSTQRQHVERSDGLVSCTHLRGVPETTDLEAADVCEDCVTDGTQWVHLRVCLACGHVGCCDSSPRRHATVHFQSTRHPVVQSAEDGESWRWCYVDGLLG